MEVGMTTAERRRRRRRGGGLRVPSDNVPRRSSTPPVVAPVPEDPALAIRFRKRAATDPVDDVDVELDSIDSLTDGGTTLDQDDDEDADAEVAEVPEVDSSELSTIDPSDEPGEPAGARTDEYPRTHP